MDDLNNSFGRLSTRAPVFRPGGGGGGAGAGAGSDNNHGAGGGASSDLRASQVKEFVPGMAWGNNSGGGGGGGGGGHQQQKQSQQIQQTLSGASSTGAQQDTVGTPQDHNNNNGQQQQYGLETTIPSGQASCVPPPAFRALHSLGLDPNDHLYRHYRDLSIESSRQMGPADPLHKAVPNPPYCNAYCLDSNNQNQPQQQSNKRSSFGYPCSTFLVTNREDGNLYCLHRFDSVRSVSPKIAAAVTERWNAATTNNNQPVLDHPGVVTFYHCFLAQRAVFFVHQYVPGGRTLHERFHMVENLQPQQQQHLLAESVLWSCILQIVSALRVIHTAGLAVRCLDSSHVLSVPDPTTTRLRLRINCLGVVDALEFEARTHVSELQQHDIRMLGKLILSLATGSTNVLDNLRNCESFLAQNYSPELHNLTMTLLQSPRPPNIADISRVLYPHCYEEQDAIMQTCDLTGQALSSEYESGRALRLLLKLGFVNERPEFGPNRRWSQSGDCYMLSLFRDYVFHQADGAGNPIMDLGHVITSLNKLDAADEEKIVLSSRDGKSLMVVSYADVARCLESAFQELCQGSIPPAAVQY